MPKILMAVDGSDHDLKSAQFLGKLLRGAPDVNITVLSVAHLVMPTPPVMEMGMVPVMPSPQEMERWEREIRQQAQANVTRAEAAVKAAGLNVSSQLGWGNPPEVIIDIAEKGAFDLIVLGSRGAGQVAGIFLGSVSDKVAHRAKTPVLIVH